MFARLSRHAAALAEARRQDAIKRLLDAPAPPGVTVERTSEGVILVGKHLRRRLIDDPRLRSVGR